MKKYTFLLLLAALALLGGCEKSFENFTPVTSTPVDSVWSAANSGNFTNVTQLHENLVRATVTDSFNLGVASVVTFPDNTRLEIPARMFQGSAGVIADGKALVEMHLLNKKGDLIRFQKQTVSNGYLLESGGVLFLQVTKNGNPLSLIPGGSFRAIIRDSAPNALMRGFVGVEPAAGALTNFNWVRNDSLNVRTVQSPAGYDISVNNLRWINCDYFKDTADVKTRIALTMPVEFTNANTSTWIVYKNIRSVMQFDADVPNRIWKKEKVPINKPVIYISITKKGDNYWLGTVEATTGSNQVVNVHPVQKTLAEIKVFLDQL